MGHETYVWVYGNNLRNTEGVEASLLRRAYASGCRWEPKAHLETSDIRPKPNFLGILHVRKAEGDFTRPSREEGVWNLREIREDE